jgi:hypothetical protein
VWVAIGYNYFNGGRAFRCFVGAARHVSETARNQQLWNTEIERTLPCLDNRHFITAHYANPICYWFIRLLAEHVRLAVNLP